MHEYVTQAKHGSRGARTFNRKVRALLRDIALRILSRCSGPAGRPYVKALYCHHVFDDEVGAFEELILALKREGAFITTGELLAIVTGRRPTDRNYFHLSFDDGFVNVFRNAMPVLLKHQVPAISFVPTSFVGADFARASEFCLSIADYPAVIQMGTWSDWREWVKRGFEVGSHTRTHACLAMSSHDGNALANEIQGSKEDVERSLGCQCKYIAWPFGQMRNITQAASAAIVYSRYEACFGGGGGPIEPKLTDLMRVPRRPLVLEWPRKQILYFATRKEPASK